MQTNEIIEHLRKFTTCSHLKSFTVSTDCPSCAINASIAHIDSLRHANENNVRMFNSEKDARRQAEDLIDALCWHFPSETHAGPPCQRANLLEKVLELKVAKKITKPIDEYIFKEVAGSDLNIELNDFYQQGYSIEHVSAIPPSPHETGIGTFPGGSQYMVVARMNRKSV